MVPFLWLLAGLIAWIGNLSAPILGVVFTEVLLLSGYLVIRSRRMSTDRAPVSRLLPLLPGHLLVLLIVALLDAPDRLAWLWTIIPAATIGYDAWGRGSAGSPRVRMSISIALYGILWVDLFFLLGRAVLLHRGLAGSQAVVIATALGLVGALFLSVGVYRHWNVVKE